METMKRLGSTGIIPVVVIDDVKNACETARALLAGGVDVMEITLRTAAALDAIREVAENCPNMLVGAGTVLTIAQGKQAVAAGAKFIVSPGFDASLVRWCIDNGIPITPGCVTPTEIMAALEMGLRVVKFFPSGIYGGLPAMKALSGPFPEVQFIPTGGINAQNLSEYAQAPFVFSVGGSWLCTAKDIQEGRFEKITKLCTEAVQTVLGFELAHVGLNTEGSDESEKLVLALQSAFGFTPKYGTSSNFAGAGIEVMKSMYLGCNGHIAIRTNRIDAAVAYLEKRGYVVDRNTAKYKNDRLAAVYLADAFGGFAFHLLQK